MIQRRKFLTGLSMLVCSPAIVRASSIMPVRSWVGDGVCLTSMPSPDWLVDRIAQMAANLFAKTVEGFLPENRGIAIEFDAIANQYVARQVIPA